MKKFTFINPNGDSAGAISPEIDTGSVKKRDVEIARGNLTEVLFELTMQKSIHYQFSDSISTLNKDNDGVNVSFESGKHGKFDIVIGADGLHSNIRRLVFGEERQFSQYLGYCFSGFTMANDLDLSHEAMIYATPGRTAALYAAGKCDTLHALLVFMSKEPPVIDHHDRDKQLKLTAEKFAGLGWKIPNLVESMQEANDLYYDVVSQIHMPHWSVGRVALVGDSAFAPSFMSGQGTSLALVGAYILAGELASHEDHRKAFENYEKIMRPFAEANQNLANGGGSSFIYPRTNEELEARNQALIALQSSDQKGLASDESEDVYSSLFLPKY